MSDTTENTVKTREQLKQTFVDGAIPRGSDFADIFDAFVHKNDEPASSDEITQLEQYLAIYYATAESDGDPSRLRTTINSKRLPYKMMDGGEPTNGFVGRTVLFYRGKFYDNNQAGNVLHVFGSVAFSPHTSNEDEIVTVNIDGNPFTFFFNPSSERLDEPQMLSFLITGNRTVESNGFTFVFTVGESQTDIEIIGSRDTIGMHSCEITYGEMNYVDLYGDAEHTESPEYGTDDADGYYIESPQDPTYNQKVRLYLKLIDEPNPSTAALNYNKIECFYCDSADLQPGVYYYDDNSGRSWYEQLAVEASE